MEEVVQNFASDTVLINMTEPDDPRSGDALRQTVANFRTAYEDDMKIDIQTIFDDGRMVACEADIGATRKDNSRWELVHYAIIASVENDKIVAERYYWNPGELAED